MKSKNIFPQEKLILKIHLWYCETRFKWVILLILKPFFFYHVVTRAKSVDVQKRKTARTVFLVYVVGKKNCGKTAFLQSFVENYVGNFSKDAEISSYSINSVQLRKQEVYIIVRSYR